ncbi:MAG: hypothetical protein C4321_10000 [Chloroflexota bacterium]
MTSYTQASSSNMPADQSTDDADPDAAGPFTEITTTPQVYDSASLPANAGRNGSFLQLVLGVSSLYTGGPGTNRPVPTIELIYDEA